MGNRFNCLFPYYFNLINMNETIKYYKNQYFNLIQILNEEGEKIEIGNDFKYTDWRKDEIGSLKGYKKCKELKLCWLKYYNFDEGIKLLDESFEYIFFKDGVLFNNLLINKKVGYNERSFIERKNLFVTHFTLYNRFSELVYDIWNDMLKNKKIGLLIDINNLDELYHLKIKKSGYEISNMSFLNKFEMIDIDTNKPIINKIKELNNINKFRNDRIELLDNLDEWYNISSKWVNKINK